MARQHTVNPAKLATRTPVLERKVKPDGTVREYSCLLLYHDATVAVVEFVMTHGVSVPELPIAIPPGSVSHGFFWPRRPYNLYRMRGPDGALIAHRFDAVTAVSLTQAAIEYRDLVLDWWALPSGAFIEEDRDEYEDLLKAGRISAADAAITARAAHLVSTRYRRVIAEAAALERALNIPPIRQGLR